MGDLIVRFWSEITARPAGPMAFRFYLQPITAILLATRDGLADARQGKPAYFWAIFNNGAQHRRSLLRHGWKSIRRVFLLAAAMDVVYQLLVLRALRPIEAIAVAVVLAIIPYLTVRGPVNRIARRLARRDGSNFRRTA